MTTAPLSNRRIWTGQRAGLFAALLIASGILITPVQWYLAYIGLEREKGKSRQFKQNREKTDSTQRRIGIDDVSQHLNVTDRVGKKRV